MKVFNWDTCSEKGKRKGWLIENHFKPVTEAEFLQAYEDTREEASHSHRSPSYARLQYKNLKNHFGFFK